MSKTIDEYITSMKFDNQNFEKNVSTTMSTLDKLKQKLNLGGASKGLESIGAASKRVDMSGLASGITEVHSRFSALEVMGVTALANITNAAVNAGKGIVSSLTVAPVMDGWREYELTLGAIQTTMAGTGKSMEEVEEQLKRLDKYADDTIYSSADMFTNLPKFTNAGVELEKATTAMIGISNATALAGGDATKASIAFYNLGQSIGTGWLTRMDYNSINNAGIATMEWKNQMIEAALAQGTLTKAGEDAYVAGGKTFSMQQLFIDGLQEQWASTNVLMDVFEDYGDTTTEIGKKAQASAQNIKTFSMMLESLKATAGTGWKDTWQLIFGDLGEATKFWTGVNNSISKVVTGMADARNDLLKNVLGSKWDIFTEKINKAGVSTDDFTKKLKEVAKGHDIDIDKLIGKYGSLEKVFQSGKISTELITETLKKMAGGGKEVSESTENMSEKLKKFQNIVNEVWSGDYKNGSERIKELTDAGYEYSEVQKLVNKTVDGHKLTLEDLSETQLKAVGYTEKEITAIQKLAKEAEKAGTPLNELIDDLNKPTGRDMLFGSIANMIQPLATILSSLKTAWKDAFPPSQFADMLYNFISGLYSFSKALVIGKEDAENLTRTLKGVFAIIDIITTILGGGFKIAFDIFCKVLSTLWTALGFANTNILEITASIGDVIVAFRNWLEEHNLINKAIEFVVPLLVSMAKAFIDLVKVLWELEVVQDAITAFKDSLRAIGDTVDKYFGPSIKAIKKFIDNLKELKGAVTFEDFAIGFKDLGKTISESFKDVNLLNVGKNIIDGLVNGIQNGASLVWEAIKTIGQGLVDSICNLLGIHSPSLVFTEIGGNIISGLCNGIKNGLSFIVEAIKSIFSTIMDVAGTIDFGDIFVVGSVVAVIFLLNKLIKVIGLFGSAFESLGDVFEGAGMVLKSTSKFIDAKTTNIKTDSLLNIAKAIGILAISLAILTLVDQDKLLTATAVLAVLGGGLIALMKVAEKIDNGAPLFRLGGMMVGIGASLLIMSFAVKQLASVDPGRATIAILEMAALMAGLVGLLYIYGKFVKGEAAHNIDKAGKMLLKMAIGISIMALVVKLVAGLSYSDIGKGMVFIGGVTILFGLIIAVSSIAGRNADKAGKMIFKMGVAIGILVLVTKLIAGMSYSDITKGLVFVAGATLLFGAIVILSNVAGRNADKAGKMLLKMSLAIGILALSMKLIAGMSYNDVQKGLTVIKGVSVVFAGMVLLTSIIKEDKVKSAGNLFLKMGIAIGAIAIAMKLIGGISPGDISKGLITIAGITAIFAALVFVSKFAGEHASSSGSMILKMALSIGILAIAMKIVAGLSPSDIAKGLVTIAGIGLVFAAVVAVSKFAGQHAEEAGKMLIKMSLAMLIMVGSIALLSLLDHDDIAVATAAITAIGVMFSILIASTKFAQKATGTLILLAGIVAVLGGILYVLSGLPVANTLAVSASLSTLLLSLALSLQIISYMGPSAMLGVGVMALMVLIVGMLGGMLYILQDLPVANTLAVAASLSMLLLSLSASCLILSVVGATGAAAFIGIGALITLIVSIGTLMAAIGALTTYYPDMEQFLNKGLSMLTLIGEGLGSFFGGVVNGLLSEASESIPTLATKLSEFMTNLQPFIAGAANIDPAMAAGVASIAKAILLLTAADVLDGITSWLTGGSDIGAFGAQLVLFGKGLKGFAAEVAGLDSESISNSAKAALALAEMASKIPNEGGLLGFFAGENKLDVFATQLVAFGKGLKGYAIEVTGLDTESISNSAKAGQALAEMASKIPNEGGLLGLFTGENRMDTFASQLGAFGKGLKAYSEAVVGVNPELVAESAKAAHELVKMSEDIPEEGGFFSLFGGDNKLDTFAAHLKAFGTGIADYSKAVENVNVEKVASSAAAVKKLVSVIQSMEGMTSTGAATFKTSINTLAQTNVAGFVKAFSGQTEQLKSIGSNLFEAIISGIKSKKESLTTATKTLLDSMKSAIKSKESSFNKSGSDIVKEFCSGIKAGDTKAEKAMKTVLKAASGTIKDYYDDFYEAGSYLVTGFANGISDNNYKASAKASAMASAALTAAKKALKEKSPSRAFYEVGDYGGQGFVNALSDYKVKASRAGYRMADSARLGLTKAIGKISDAINLDLDAQPTIRPVLDLSDITNGVGTMNGMFGVTPSIGLLSRVSSINSTMGKGQNGVNDALISEVKGLKKALSQKVGDTYIIDGVSYDDGSAVSDAMKTIVRASRVERRK